MYPKFQVQIDKFLEKTGENIIAQKIGEDLQVYVWTENYIIFSDEYDNMYSLSFLPRNPIDIAPSLGGIYLENYLEGDCDLKGNYL